MVKRTTVFVCSVCGYDSQKWYGRCPECQNWNTFSEIKVEQGPRRDGQNALQKEAKRPIKIANVEKNENSRTPTGFDEFDRVLGGGLVAGEVVLLSGDPGIGKSTILLQIALNLATQKGTVLYVSGEESESQIKMRAERIESAGNLKKSNLMLLATSEINDITNQIEELKPSLIVIDSIQTIAASNLPGFPGSLPQVRYCTQKIVECAKAFSIPTFLIGHVTKEGIVAGPMLLAHMVDAVFYLEGDRFSGLRILRAFKNRFADISEVGLFVMEEKGLIQIQNASTFFFEKKMKEVPGSCVSIIIEGSRPILVEVQALIVPSTLSFPRRVVSGVADKRVELLLAVIQKYIRLPLEKLDVFVNIVGGLKVTETATDLAIALAVVASFKNIPVSNSAGIAEIGLLGELRPVAQLDKRIKEAKKFGIKKILTSKDFNSLKDVVQSII